VSKHIGKRFAAVTIKKLSCVLPYGLFLLLTSNLQSLKRKSFPVAAHAKAPIEIDVLPRILLFSTYALQPSRLIVRSGLAVPTFDTRRLHACPLRRKAC